MRNSRLVRFVALVAAMMCALGAAAAEAYACYTPSNKTLTFYYDNNRSSRPGTTYDMNTGYSTPGWFVDTHETLVEVTFDATFKNARPTSTYSWFYTMPNLRSINGISNLNTSSVTVMQNMFNGCSSLYYLDLSGFNTSNVTDMSLMFCDCSNLTVIDLSGFNTSKVTSMGSMFQNCSNLTTIYAGSGWTTDAVTNSGFMFRNCTSLVGDQGTTYQSSNPANKTYARIDGGPSNPGYFTDGNAPMAYACYTSSNKTLTFYCDTQRRSRTGTTYFMNTRDVRTGWYIDDLSANVTKVVFNPSFADARPTSLYLWFYEMSNLQTIMGINYLNTSEVTNMAFTFCNCEKLTSLDLSHFNTDKVTTMQYMFIDCPKLTSLDLTNFNTAGVTDMEGLFSDCHNLTTIYAGSGWSTDGVTAANTAYMFADCYSLVGGQGTAYDENHTGKDYAHIDGGPSNPGYFTAGTEAYACYTPSNTTMTFYYDNLRYSRTGTTFALNSGANFPAWFDGSTNENVTKVVFNSSFADARPTTTHGWFDEMYELTSVQGIENLNTSEVTDMAVMFGDCSKLTAVDVSHFDTRKVTTMAYMFYYCSRLTSLNVRGFDTGNVTDMSGMFEACAGLTALDVINFNTGNVTNMYGMFEDCDGLTSLDLGNFNTSRVTDMRHMFSYCDKLRTIYVGNGWSTAAVTSSDYMFYESPSLVGGKGTTYDENHIDKAYAHIDGGPSNPGYFTDANVPRPYACYTSSNTTLTFYNDNQRSSRTGTTYDLNEGSNDTDWENDGTNAHVTKVVFDPSFAGARPTTTYDWFYSMNNLESITGMSYLNTSEVTNMAWMFTNCKKLTSLDVSHFNTAKVTDMNSMFGACWSLTSLDLSSFNTSKVTNMYNMFFNTKNLQTVYVGNGWSTAAVSQSSGMFGLLTSLVGGQGTTWNSSNPTDKTYAHIDGGPSNPGYFTAGTEAYACYTPSNTTLTFYYDNQRSSRTGTTYDLNTGSNDAGWDTDGTNASVTKVVFDPSFAGARPTTTCDWFYYMQNLESITGLNYLNTSEVTNMDYMFLHCVKLTSLDLSHFNTSNVYRMTCMFYGCYNLRTIYVGNDWSTAAVTSSDLMFKNCTSLVGGQGTTYDENHIDKAYAHIDGGPSNPGYFTAGTEAYACYTPSNTTLTFYYDNQRSSRPGTTYDLNEGSNDTGWDTDGFNARVTKVVFDPSFAGARPTTTCDWFYGMVDLESIAGMEYLNTCEVTNMRYMFMNCSKLTSLDVSHFNTSKVTSMSQMFSLCTGLTSLDLSHFNTSKVTDMSYMFSGGLNLRTIYVGNDWSTAAVTTSTDMFSYCTSLVGGQGTTYDENHIDKAYAHIDGGPSNPGYFTAKNASLRGDVNGDGEVAINDVSALIDYLLTGNASSINLSAADCNIDGEVAINDVSRLIDYLLTGNW